MKQDHNQTNVSDDLLVLVADWLEVVEEIRPQMDDPADTPAELVHQLLWGDSSPFGSEHIALEMGIIAGKIEGIALARGITAEELLAQLPPKHVDVSTRGSGAGRQM